jgi:hypothetical protein
MAVSRRKAAHEQGARDAAAYINRVAQDCASLVISVEYADALLTHLERELDLARRNIKRARYERVGVRVYVDAKGKEVLQE